MYLTEYLNLNKIKRKDFADKLNISYNHLNVVLSANKKPGEKLCKAVKKETRGEVTIDDLLSYYEKYHKPKKHSTECQSYTCAPSEKLVRSKSSSEFIKNLSHIKPLEISLCINGVVLFRKVLHCEENNGEKGYNYCDDKLKLRCRISDESKDKSGEIIEQGIPPVDPDTSI